MTRPRDVGGAAVIPFRARLAHQRHAGDQLRMLFVGDVAAEHLGLGVHALHHPHAGDLVGDAGGVAQQVLDGDRPHRQRELHRAVALDADLLAGEFGNELGKRIVEQQFAVFHQHHDAERDQRLGHREDAEDAVLGHRRVGGRVLPALRLEPADLATPRHHRHHAGRRALVDLALEGVAHPLKPQRREPDRFRLCRGKGGGRLGGGCGVDVHGASGVSCALPARTGRGRHLRRTVAQNARLEQRATPAARISATPR